jgi:hypothetical protein
MPWTSASSPARQRGHDVERDDGDRQRVTGWETSAYEFLRWGERRNHLMRVYNLREVSRR